MYKNATPFLLATIISFAGVLPLDKLTYEGIELDPTSVTYHNPETNMVIIGEMGSSLVKQHFINLNDIAISVNDKTNFWLGVLMTTLAIDEADDEFHYVMTESAELAYSWLSRAYAINLFVPDVLSLTDEQLLGLTIRIAEDYPEIMAGCAALVQAETKRMAERAATMMLVEAIFGEALGLTGAKPLKQLMALDPMLMLPPMEA